MAKATTTFTISAEDKTKQGIQSAESSFKQFTSQIDSITGGLGSKITNLLANPWTAVAAGIGVGTKALKDLTEAGMTANDRLDKFTATLGSRTDAQSLIGTIASLSDMSWESRESIEAFALKLAGAGHSAEETKSILSATVDICNTTGRGFNEVGSAIENAFNGETATIEKILPSLKDLGSDAWNSGDAIKYIGDQLHDASIQIASGSLSNQLGALGNSWERIKENLGGSIVTQIQSTGVLNTISEWLQKIEEHTRKTSEESNRKATINLGIEGGKAGVENLLRGGIVTEAELKDLIGTKRTQLSSAGFEVPSYLEEAWSWVSGGRQTLIDKYNEEFYNILKGWEEYYQYRPEWEIAQQISRLETFNTESEYSIYNKEGYEKLLGQMQSRMSSREASTSSTLHTSTAEILTKCAWGKFDQVTAEDWETVFETLSLSDDLWEMWSDDAFAYYDAWNLSKVPAPQVAEALPTVTTTSTVMTYAEHMARRQANDAIRNRISAQLAAQAPEALPTVTTTSTVMTYAEHMARRQANDAIRNRISAQLAAQAPEEVYRRDHSILGLAMQDMGLGYAPVGYDTVAPSYAAFGVSSLWLNGLNGPQVTFGRGEDPSFWNIGVGRRTTGGGGVNTLEGWFLDSTGKWQNIEEYEAEQARIAKEEQEAADKRFNDITSNIKTVIGTLQNLTNIWKDGYQTGDISSTISTIGAAIPGKIGTILSLVGLGGSLLSSWLGSGETDLSGTTDEDYHSSVATYNGGLNLHINNYFEGANIVGEGGMTELALKIQKQIEHFAYDNV